MSICLYLDPTHCRRWHWDLLDMLCAQGQGRVVVAFSQSSVLPPHIEHQLRREKALYLPHEEIGSDPFDKKDWLAHLPEGVSPLTTAKLQEEAKYDLLLDLVGDGNAPHANQTITLLFNGHPGDKALITSIMSEGMPQIALRDGDGRILATALPSGELAVALPGSMDQAYCRVITLLRAWFAYPNRKAEPLVDKKADWPSARALAKSNARSLLRAGMMKLYYRLFRPSHWRIGWRWLDEATNQEVSNQEVWHQKNLGGKVWQVLEDKDNHFYADPVPCFWQGRHFLFFEDLDPKTNKGVISVVEMGENGPLGEAEICLEEDYHLSYPFLWEHEGEILMIPETSNNRDVAIYRATNFPFGWERKTVILSDIDAADVTITRFEGKYWIFCVTRDGTGGYSDCLSIFHADKLEGPWHPHAQNPVLINAATVRPAGNFFQKDGRLYRPVQNCSRHYGAEIGLVEVTHLSPTDYEQQPMGNLVPGKDWPGRKLHMLNRAGNLEVIDGAILRPRLELLRKGFDHLFAPKA